MSQNLFKWKHYESEIILLCVRWVHEYSPIIDEKIRNHLKETNDSWRVDETYIKVKRK